MMTAPAGLGNQLIQRAERMIDGLLRRWRTPQVNTAAGLAAFLDQNASLIAQKTVIGYCHVKTNMPLGELLQDKPFFDAFEVARWEAFAVVLADLVMVAETYLRPLAGGRLPALADRLAGLYREILAGHPLPAQRPDGWGAEVESVRARLAAAQETLPQSIGEIAEISARRLYDALPIHERLREPDQPAVEASVRFMMVGLAHKFNGSLDLPAIAADLLAQSAVPETA